jgi:hypothetical protein
MILLAIDPVSFSSARVRNCQHLNVTSVLSKNADVRKAYHSSVLEVEVNSRESAGICFYFHQYIGNCATKSLRSIGRFAQIPIDCLIYFVRCFFAKANHLPNLLSILRLTSSHGMPGEGSFALLSNSCRNAGSSTEKRADELSMESSNSVASKIRSPSGRASADLKSSSCDIAIIDSNCERYVPRSILIETACLLSQPAQVVFELRVDLFETSVNLLLTCSITAGGNEELVAIRANFERGISGNLEHIQDWLVYHESQAVPVFDQHFLHRFDLLRMVSQSVYRNSGKVKLSLDPHAIPTTVLEHIHILGATVTRELVESGATRHDSHRMSVGEAFGRSVVSERSNIAACDQRSCRLDRCVIVFEDSAGVVLLAGNRCSCGDRLVSLLRWFLVVGFDHGDAILGQSQHERAAVVPVDIDLRPIAILVNGNYGSQRSNRNRVWILWHRHQSDAIAFFKLRFHSFVDGLCRFGFQRFNLLGSMGQLRYESCKITNVFPPKSLVIWTFERSKKLTDMIEVIECGMLKILVGSYWLKLGSFHEWLHCWIVKKCRMKQSAMKAHKEQADMGEKVRRLENVTIFFAV